MSYTESGPSIRRNSKSTQENNIHNSKHDEEDNKGETPSILKARRRLSDTLFLTYILDVKSEEITSQPRRTESRSSMTSSRWTRASRCPPRAPRSPLPRRPTSSSSTSPRPRPSRWKRPGPPPSSSPLLSLSCRAPWCGRVSSSRRASASASPTATVHLELALFVPWFVRVLFVRARTGPSNHTTFR